MKRNFHSLALNISQYARNVPASSSQIGISQYLYAELTASELSRLRYDMVLQEITTSTPTNLLKDFQLSKRFLGTYKLVNYATGIS